MKILSRIQHAVHRRFYNLFWYYLVPDRWYLKHHFKEVFGTNLDLDHPKTYNEKLQWLKLYDRNPLYHILVDKYLVKKWVAEKIGEQYVIPTLGVWNRAKDINWDRLPQKFVIKCNHDSASVIICRDKAKLDKEKACKKLQKCLGVDYYHIENKQWAYKNVKRVILAEELLEDGTGHELMDYKFFCFNGEPKIMYMSRDKDADVHTDFFDMDFNHLPIRMAAPNSDVYPPKPENFEKMKELASILSQGIPHVRVDFYMVKGHIYFGEMTFYHCGGKVLVRPEEWNIKMGEMIPTNK